MLKEAQSLFFCAFYWLIIVTLQRISQIKFLEMNIPLLSFGSTEWIALIVLALLLFGGKKIPELMRGLGKGMREFNDAKNNVREELEAGINDTKKD